MLDKSLWSNIDHMVSGSLAKFLIIPESSNRLNSVKVFDRFLNGGRSLLRSECRLSWLLQEIALESAQPLLQIGDEGSWIGTQLIL